MNGFKISVTICYRIHFDSHRGLYIRIRLMVMFENLINAIQNSFQIWNIFLKPSIVVTENWPQMISRAHLVIYGVISSIMPSLSSVCLFNLSANTCMCSLIMGRKSSKIRKWNDGVSSFLLERHFSPPLYISVERKQFQKSISLSAIDRCK